MAEKLIINNFAKGLITRIPDTDIPEDAFSDCQNIELNDKFLPTKMNGHVKYNSYGIDTANIKGGIVYTLTNGTKYYVIACGGTLYYSVAGSGTFTAYQIGGNDLTIDADSYPEFVQYNDNLYIVNGKYPIITNGGYTTSRMIKIANTTPTELTDSNIPQGAKYLILHKERLFAGNSIDQPNGLYWSEPYDPETWIPSVGLNYDFVGKDDGENITGIVDYQDYVFVGKPRNVYRYSTIGDISEWTSTRVDTTNGWLYHRTIKEMEGYLYYLSVTGVIKFDGNNTYIVSGQIRDKILGLAQLGTSLQQWLQTATSDFEAGDYSATLVDVSNNELKQLPMDDEAFWDTCTKDNVKSDGSGNVALDTPSEIAFGTDIAESKDVIDVRAFINEERIVDGDDNTYATAVGGGPTFTRFIIDLAATYSIWKTDYKLTIFSYAPPVVINISYSTDDISYILWQQITLYNGSYIDSLIKTTPVDARYIKMEVVSGGYNYFDFYYLKIYETYNATGIITSPVLDTGFIPYTSSYLRRLVSNYTDYDGSTLSFETRSSTDDISWDAWLDLSGTPEIEIDSENSRYIQWRANFTRGDSSPSYNSTSILDKVYLTSMWKSTTKDLGAAATAWGTIDASFLTYTLPDSQPAIVFYIRSATTEGGLTAATWHEQTANTPIVSVPLNRWIEIHCVLYNDDIVELPELYSIQINYYFGEQIDPPCAVIWKNNYWLNVADSGSPRNDIVYRFNKDNYWLIQTNKNNNLYMIDENNLLSGTSKDDGFVQYQDTGLLDYSADILTNFGEKWNEVNISNDGSYGMAISANGQYQTITELGDYIYISSDYGTTWAAKDSQRNWNAVVMSADGQYQTALVNTSDYIYISIDYGATWTAKDSQRSWKAVAMSADGQYQTAVVSSDYIYISTDYGATWTAKDSQRNWNAVAMSADGQYQTAVVSSDYIYISIDYGATWTAKSSQISRYALAMSTDGQYQTALAYGDYIYISTDYGATWTAKDSQRNWNAVAMSDNGKYQTAVVDASDYIYISIDYGATWTAKDSQISRYVVAMSADGRYQTALQAYGYINVSSDYGATWTAKIDIKKDWISVAMSADGQYQLASVVTTTNEIWKCYSDYIAPIDSWFETRNYELSSMINLFRSIFVSSKSADSWILSYSIDNGSYVDISISTSNYVSTIKKLFSGIKRGQFIKFKIRQNLEDNNFEFHKLILNWEAWRELNND